MRGRRTTGWLIGIGLVLALLLLTPQLKAATEWISLFDGATLRGWTASENKKTWSVQHGALYCEGPRSHLFYSGPHAPFRNFELKAEVKTMPGANSGIYFLTKYQPKGWPENGLEAQINNSYPLDPKRTGSLYGVVDVLKSPAQDERWFTLSVIVRGDEVTVRVNGKVTSRHKSAALRPGTFALQAHDPQSKVYFRSIKVRRL